VQALQVSCNVYFWAVGERVGLEGLAGAARDLGFGAASGLGIDGESPGVVPDRTTRDLRGPEGLAYTLRTAIGNGDVRVTAVQLAMAYGAIANGGRLYAAQLVRRIQTASGWMVEERAPILRRRISVSPATLDILHEGMWRVVNAAGGTASSARRGAIPMAGKTGTATPVRRPEGQGEPAAAQDLVSHAWFAGWAPVGRPQIVAVVLVEHGGVGGKVAAPVARAIIDGSFAALERQRLHESDGGTIPATRPSPP
jgi:penicillin-binding protein 2